MLLPVALLHKAARSTLRPQPPINPSPPARTCDLPLVSQRLRRTSKQPAGTAFVSPTNFMTKGVAGPRMMSVGVPCCSTMPRLKITT